MWAAHPEIAQKVMSEPGYHRRTKMKMNNSAKTQKGREAMKKAGKPVGPPADKSKGKSY